MTHQSAISNPQATTTLILIMGVAGSGKSTLARALGDIYHYQYLDGDDFHSIEARALMAQGVALTDEHRTPWVAAIKHRLQSNAAEQIHSVLAFSGLKKKHRDELRSAGLRTIVLYLKGSRDIIQDRINKRTDHFMAPELLHNQFANMEEPEQEADVYRVEIWPTIEQVVAQARGIIDAVLIPSKHQNC